MKPWGMSFLGTSGKESQGICSVHALSSHWVESQRKLSLGSRYLSLKRGCVFLRPQEEEGETAGEAPQVHRAATERTSPVSFMSRLSSSWESLLPEPGHPI